MALKTVSRSWGAVGASAERAWEPAPAPGRALTAEQATRRPQEPRQQHGQQHGPRRRSPRHGPARVRLRTPGRYGGGAGRPAAARSATPTAGGCSISPAPTDPAPGGGGEGEEPACRPSAPGDVTAERAAPPAGPPPEPPPARSAPDTRPAPLGASQGHPAFARGVEPRKIPVWLLRNAMKTALAKNRPCLAPTPPPSVLGSAFGPAGEANSETCRDSGGCRPGLRGYV